MKRCTWLKPCLWAAIVALLVCGLPAWAQGQTAAPSAPAAAPAPPPLAVDAPLNVSGPSADDQAAGDPSGTKTGTANDVVHADPDQTAHPGGSGEPGRPEPHRDQLYLDTGHRLPGHVHAGRFRHRRNRTVPRQERQPHHDDELHGLWLRSVRLLGVRFCHPDGRSCRHCNAGWRQPAQSRVHHSSAGTRLGPVGHQGILPLRRDL